MQFSEYTCDCKAGFVGDGYICRRPRGDEGGDVTVLPNSNADGNIDSSKPSRVPEPTCLFSVCSCPSGWALNSDNMNNKKCIEAPQPQGKESLIYIQVWYSIVNFICLCFCCTKNLEK